MGGKRVSALVLIKLKIMSKKLKMIDSVIDRVNNTDEDVKKIINELNVFSETTFVTFSDTRHHYFRIDGEFLLITQEEKSTAEKSDLENYLNVFKMFYDGYYIKYPIIHDGSLSGIITHFVQNNIKGIAKSLQEGSRTINLN